MAVKLQAGQTRWTCLCCEHEQVKAQKDKVIFCDHEQIKVAKSQAIFCGTDTTIVCEHCGQIYVNATEARPTAVTGAGRGQAADLGLALLMEMSEGSPLELFPNGWTWGMEK